LDQLIALSDQVRALARCGVPLEPGLAAMSQEMPGRQGTIAAELASSGQAGQSVEQWLQENSARLPDVFRAMVLAGIRSGRLGVALEGFVATARRAADLRRSIGVSLLYPLLVLILVSLLASAILRLMAGHYESLQQMGGIHEDSPLQWLIPWVRLAGNWAWLIAPVALVLALVWWIGTRPSSTLEMGRFARWMSWLPGTRRMLRSSYSATFSDLLALLIEQGVPLNEALELAAQAGGDLATRTEAKQLVEEISKGGKVTLGRGRRDGISPLVRWLLAFQTDSIQLVSALKAHSQAERRRATHMAEWLRIQVPVILTLGIGGSATLLYALSVFAPWYGLLYDFARP
jgi:type II secretory pathway component PulF